MCCLSPGNIAAALTVALPRFSGQTHQVWRLCPGRTLAWGSGTMSLSSRAIISWPSHVKRALLAVSAAVAAIIGLQVLCTVRTTRPTRRDALVVLTRASGKNGRLGAILERFGIRCTRFPCVRRQRLPGGAASLRSALMDGKGWDAVVVTSPAAASELAEAAASNRLGPGSKMRVGMVGAVGTTTARACEPLAAGRSVFVPSVARAEALARELPLAATPDRAPRVLFPASALASGDVESGFASRGCDVRRIDVYTTVPTTRRWAHPLAPQPSCDTLVVALASPSAVRAWVSLGGQVRGATAACIGRTTANACEGLGFARVCYPDKPGLDSWAEVILQAVGLRSKK